MNVFMKNLRYEYDVIVGLLESEKDNYPERIDKYIYKELSDDIINDYKKAYDILETFVNEHCRVKCNNGKEYRYKSLTVYFTKPSLLIPLLTTTITYDLRLYLIQCCPDGSYKQIDNFFGQATYRDIYYPFEFEKPADVYSNLSLGTIYDMEKYHKYGPSILLLLTYSSYHRGIASNNAYYICTLDDIDETFDMLCEKARNSNINASISIETHAFEYAHGFEKTDRIDKYCKKF